MNLERARLTNPERTAKCERTEVEYEVKNLAKSGEAQTRLEYRVVTYEYTAPFNYPNFKVEMGDESQGAEFNTDGLELDVPPYGAVTFVEDEPIVGVDVIGSTCVHPGTVYLHCEPVVWKYPRTGVKLKIDNLWGEHVRGYAWKSGIDEAYKSCGLFSACFSVPDSKKITVMGHGAFDIEQRDYDVSHHDAHLVLRVFRVHVKKPL